jgi:DNA topoisomerase VI subunit B
MTHPVRVIRERPSPEFVLLGGARRSKTLTRATFTTSRLLDFCSEKELVKQIGHAPDKWPLVILKELVDNSIDAIEETSNAATIRIEVSDSKIVVADNGPGIAPETLTDILNFSVRVSSREAYVSPTRGAQGNALKTIIAMPFALDGNHGEIMIESRGLAHHISFKVDHVRQEPKIDHQRQASPVKKGTRTTVIWPECASTILERAKGRFLQIAEDFGWLNPHLALSLTWDGERCINVKASDPHWLKWRPFDPTSPHWYDEARLRRLIAAYVARDQDQGRTPRTVREFVSEFRGLSGTAKQKLLLEEIGASRLSLSDFFGDGDHVNHGRIRKLHAAMQRHSKPVNAKDLGCIGMDHLAARFKTVGADLLTFQYRRMFGQNDGVPDVIEAAFAWCPEGANERRIICGVNWSPALDNPFRHLDGESLDSVLAEQQCGRRQPIVLVLHLARPRIEYTDHGKTAVNIPGSFQDDDLDADDHADDLDDDE